MKLSIASILGLLAFLTIAKSSHSQSKTRKAVFVIVDGIPADVIEKLDPPNLKLIARQGGYARAHVGGDSGTVTQTPTISAVGYNSLLTGTWVNKHNVWDNDIKAPNYNYWNIFRLFKRQYPQKKTAVFSTWLDNRTKLVGSEAAAAGNFQPDFYFDGLEHDTIRYPHDKNAQYIYVIDEAVTDTAAAVIKRNGPDLSWVYLEFTDDMGHRYGDSKQFYDAIEIMDKQMGRLWSAIQDRSKKFNEDWVVYITTDHGRSAATGQHHGGQSKRERTTWIVSNAKGLNNYFFRSEPGIVDIMPSIARFLDVQIPAEQLFEIDGIPLTGKLSAIELRHQIEKDKLDLKWTSVDKKGKAKVWLSTTNHFKEGGKDKYILLASVPVASNGISVDLKLHPSSFYKIVIEMPHNNLSGWIIAK